MNPSISEIAKRTTFSKSTVSRALRNSPQISDATKAIVASIAAAIGYVPNVEASIHATRLHARVAPLAQKRTGMITLIYYKLKKADVLRIEYFCNIACLLQDSFQEVGISIIEAYPQTEDEYLNLLNSSQSDGIIVLSSIANIRAEFIPKLKLSALTKPVVFLSNYLPDHDHEFNCVRADNETMGQMGTRYLLEKGAKNILFIDNMYNQAILEDRFAGYKRVMEKAGLPISRVSFNANADESGGNIVDGAEFSIPDGPVGFLLGGDSLALSFSRFLSEKKFLRPDLLIAGMDGRSQLGADDKRIATVAIDFPAMARACIHLIDDILENRTNTPQKVLVGASIYPLK